MAFLTRFHDDCSQRRRPKSSLRDQEAIPGPVASQYPSAYPPPAHSRRGRTDMRAGLRYQADHTGQLGAFAGIDQRPSARGAVENEQPRRPPC